jgi:hypothetical protein
LIELQVADIGRRSQFSSRSFRLRVAIVLEAAASLSMP